VNIEWARVAAGKVVVATPHDAWLHRSRVDGLPDDFGHSMTARGRTGTTRWLLDGAIGAASVGWRASSAAQPLTPIRWAWRLAGFYRTTEATSRLLPEAARRFGAAGRRALEAWARMRTREERGHDRLALRDIAGLGYDPPLVVERFAPPGACALVDYFTRAVRDTDDPIGCVGYSYVLERLAAERGAADVDAIETMLPPGVRATRCLRVHSAAGSDEAHIASTIEMVARLSAREREAVATACYETARLFYCTNHVKLPDDDELNELLAPHSPRRTDGQKGSNQDRHAQP